MTPSGARPLDPGSWIGLPMPWALGGTILLAVPLRVAGLPLPEPVSPLALVCAWAVSRPAVLARFAVLRMGLLLDVFWGSPPGLWARSMLVAYGATLSARYCM